MADEKCDGSRVRMHGSRSEGLGVEEVCINFSCHWVHHSGSVLLLLLLSISGDSKVLAW
jgi:hypothetical protein